MLQFMLFRKNESHKFTSVQPRQGLYVNPGIGSWWQDLTRSSYPPVSRCRKAHKSVCVAAPLACRASASRRDSSSASLPYTSPTVSYAEAPMLPYTESSAAPDSWKGVGPTPQQAQRTWGRAWRQQASDLRLLGNSNHTRCKGREEPRVLRQLHIALVGAHLALLLRGPLLLLLLLLQQHVVMVVQVVVVQGHRSPVLHGGSIHRRKVGPQHSEHPCPLRP